MQKVRVDLRGTNEEGTPSCMCSCPKVLNCFVIINLFFLPKFLCISVFFLLFCSQKVIPYSWGSVWFLLRLMSRRIGFFFVKKVYFFLRKGKVQLEQIKTIRMIRRSTHGGESSGRSFPFVPYKPSIPGVGFFFVLKYLLSQKLTGSFGK